MRAIFLHTGWRSAGTLLWHVLRASASCKTFYEPLHESLSNIEIDAFGKVGAGSWNSSHPKDSTPYFEEYFPLLSGPQKIGVAGARTRFAFDDFFLPATTPDEDLRAYVSRLCEAAWQEDRLPVLKFTRSLGRVPWFRAQFPEAAHIVVIRDPWTQFRSAWRSLMESRNGYFLAVPFVIMERNIAVPDVAALVSALDLPVDARTGTDALTRLEFWRLAVQRLPFYTLYRANLALWMLNAARALPEPSHVLDMGGPITEVQAMFAKQTGLTLDLGKSQAPAAKMLLFYRYQTRPTAVMIREIHAKANASMALFLPAATLRQLTAWTDRAAALAEHDLTGQVAVLPRPSIAHSAGLLLDTARGWVKGRSGFA